jgi:glycoprotease/Kae1 family metallohydrolase
MILGIESTAHTFGIGIFDGKKVLSNVWDMYQAKSGGIIPTDAKEHHKKVANEIYKKALSEAKLTKDQLTQIAYSAGPGIDPCLWEGYNFAKKLSEKLNIPLIPTNHCVAHVEIAKMSTGFKDPLVVYVSGGNTQIIGFENKRYRIFGETLDIGIGNALDKFARSLDLQMPGGPKIEKLASEGKNYIELPYSVKGMDLVFAGIVTRACDLAKKENKFDLCYSFQETLFSMIAEVTERALAHTEKKELILTGGVAQNKRLQEILKGMGKERDVVFSVPERTLCGDNGAMIAATAQFMKPVDFKVNPTWRTEDVEY